MFEEVQVRVLAASKPIFWCASSSGQAQLQSLHFSPTQTPVSIEVDLYNPSSCREIFTRPFCFVFTSKKQEKWGKYFFSLTTCRHPTHFLVS